MGSRGINIITGMPFRARSLLLLMLENEHFNLLNPRVHSPINLKGSEINKHKATGVYLKNGQVK